MRTSPFQQARKAVGTDLGASRRGPALRDPGTHQAGRPGLEGVGFGALPPRTLQLGGGGRGPPRSGLHCVVLLPCTRVLGL